MSQRHFLLLRLLAVLAISVLCFTGCVKPEKLPVLKGIAQRHEQEAARYTEESLKKSPVLRELDQLCQEKMPLFDGFVFLSKRATYPKRTFLTYFYSSKADYQNVKSFYVDYFTQDGWRITEAKDGGWGPSHIDFRKEDYVVKIYHGGMGEEADYAIHCEKLAAAGEAK